jgi:NAD(P)-dependent dehydrogenase (short-subunit alcohol dehydrogenase family)
VKNGTGVTQQKPDLSGKVCLVTGGTSGIGEMAACQLAELNAAVLLVGSGSEKCALVTQEIKHKTGNQAVTSLAADLSIQDEVRRIAAEFQRRYQRLDVLVNNAGEVFMYRRLTPDGIERTFALDHLSYFLLTNLLLPALLASAPARVINLTSAIHTQGRLDFSDLQNRRGYNGLRAYSQSKLANLLFTFELARRLEGSRVTVNALHPGYVVDSYGPNRSRFLKPVLSLLGMGGITPEEAARNVTYLASSPDVEEITGSYFARDRSVTSLVSYDEETARLLWEVSAELTGLEDTTQSSEPS